MSYSLSDEHSSAELGDSSRGHVCNPMSASSLPLTHLSPESIQDEHWGRSLLLQPHPLSEVGKDTASCLLLSEAPETWRSKVPRGRAEETTSPKNTPHSSSSHRGILAILPSHWHLPIAPFLGSGFLLEPKVDQDKHATVWSWLQLPLLSWPSHFQCGLDHR